jgi:SWI/SNF-related matrix-associated actin-dependent regulator of chromatin subfamily E protein 1
MFAVVFCPQTNTLQPPKPPEKPLTPYMRYNKEMWDVVKGENPDLKLSEASKIIGTRWKLLTEKDKQKYADEWEAEKAVYAEQMKVYHNSPAYKAFLEAKHQQEIYLEAKQQAELAAKRQQQVMSSGQMGLSMAQQEEDESELVTMQQVAGARYLRNHRLMAEIFNDVVVPDNPKGGDSKGSSLQDKVAALTQTQKDLEQELKTREVNFRKRKKQIQQDGQSFIAEMKRLRENPLNTPVKKQAHPSKIPSISPQAAKYITL